MTIDSLATPSATPKMAMAVIAEIDRFFFDCV